MIKKIDIKNLKDEVNNIHVGDNVELSGYIYTARDAAHKKLDEMLDENMELPFIIDGAVIYYAGPTPAKEGQIIGSLGPTTSGRMDKFSPRLLSLGLKAMIGKGDRSKDVVEAIIKNKAVYFIAIGGAGALLSKCVKSCEVIAFPELGCESIKRLYIEDFPVIVAIDKYGNNIYKSQKEIYYNILNKTAKV